MGVILIKKNCTLNFCVFIKVRFINSCDDTSGKADDYSNGRKRQKTTMKRLADVRYLFCCALNVNHVLNSPFTIQRSLSDAAQRIPKQQMNSHARKRSIYLHMIAHTRVHKNEKYMLIQLSLSCITNEYGWI